MDFQGIHSTLLDKISNKEAVIAVLGLGYVGLPLMLRFAEEGYRVYGIDIDQRKVELLSQNKSYIQHIPGQKIADISHRFQATTDFSRAHEADVLILCVPTPLNKYREPDLTYVIDTMMAIQPYLRAGQLISLESTTYPGTTLEELKPRIESTGLKVGEQVFLVYSPEREDPGNIHFTTANIPKVCGGDTPQCTLAGVKLYEQVIEKVVEVSSTKVAEMTKLLENIHRSVNIGLVNEMKILADKMGINIHEVIDAAATKPFGFVPYYPGPGIGGHCIPIDPFYLTWKAREFGLHTRFIELAGEINSAMPRWVVNKVSDALNEREKAIKNSKILILGVAYKKNVDDMRESPSLEIIELLHKKGAQVSYADPHVAQVLPMRHHNIEMDRVEVTPDSLKTYDCVILATAHHAFDYPMIADHAELIIDTRAAFKQFHSPNIVRA